MTPVSMFDKTVTIARANAQPSSWDKCAASDDCRDLCGQQVTIPQGGGYLLATCERVDHPSADDAGTGGEGRDAESADASVPRQTRALPTRAMERSRFSSRDKSVVA
jgi:hypothetical protein